MDKLKYLTVILALLLLTRTSGFAQQNHRPDADPVQVFPSIQLKEWSSDPNQLLHTVLPAIGFQSLRPEQFTVAHQHANRDGYHYYYELREEGVPLFSRFVRVFVDKKLVIRQVSYLLLGVEKPRSGVFPDPEVLRSRMGNQAGTGNANRIWFYDGMQWLALTGIDVIQEGTLAYSECQYYDANYQPVFSKPLAFRIDHRDSVIQAKVFWPDPLTSAQMPYGGEYQDFNDADTPALNNERVWKPLRMRFENDTFYLVDSFFYLKDIEAPVSEVPKLTSPVADFTRSQQQFEYFNTAYHLQAWIQRVHDLGYNLPGFVLQVDPHAVNGADVSAFVSGMMPPALIFGEGGIDDAEDADVIIHELGHALSHGAAPGTVEGIDRSSFEEGNGDYFAMSYSRQISGFGWEKTFNWDGNLSWSGRVANTPKFFPVHYSKVNEYSNGEVWVSALATLYDSLGPDVTDRLVLCALYFQVPKMTFAQMADACLLCDSLQNAGANSTLIRTAMTNKGMYTGGGTAISRADMPELRILNTEGFASRGEALRLEFGTFFSGEIELLDMQGRLIRRIRLDQVESYSLLPEELKNGLYLLRVNSDTNHSVSFLISRAQ